MVEKAQRKLVQPPAVQMNTRRVVAAGTGLFFLAFVVLIPFWTWLGTHHHRDWLWTCLAGGLLGVAGWSLMVRHKRQGRTV